MLRGVTFVVLWLSLLAAMMGRASAATLRFEPRQDTTIYQEAPGNSNGAGGVFIAGRAGGIGGVPPLRRALLAFDLSGVPQGSIVQGASLTLTLTQSASVTPVALGLYNVTGAWGESGSLATAPGQGIAAVSGDATWVSRFAGATPETVWVNVGGDYSPSASATSFVGGLNAAAPTPYTWLSTAQLVADVQHWLDDPPANFGWIVIGNEGSAGTARQFASRETAVDSWRPTLTLITAPVPEPSTWLMLGAGLAFLLCAVQRPRRRASPTPASRVKPRA